MNVYDGVYSSVFCAKVWVQLPMLSSEVLPQALAKCYIGKLETPPYNLPRVFEILEDSKHPPILNLEEHFDDAIHPKRRALWFTIRSSAIDFDDDDEL